MAIIAMNDTRRKECLLAGVSAQNHLVINVIAILQQLTRVAHNSRVIDPNADPPPMLSAAEEKFSTFLTTQNYPKTICWLMPGDVVADRTVASG
jgi:hypothetical protein